MIDLSIKFERKAGASTKEWSTVCQERSDRSKSFWFFCSHFYKCVFFTSLLLLTRGEDKWVASQQTYVAILSLLLQHVSSSAASSSKDDVGNSLYNYMSLVYWTFQIVDIQRSVIMGLTIFSPKTLHWTNFDCVNLLTLLCTFIFSCYLFCQVLFKTNWMKKWHFPCDGTIRNQCKTSWNLKRK